MTEKLNRQFAVSTIFHTAGNAPLIYELDLVRPERATKARHTCDLLLPKLQSGEVRVKKART
ncbi:MAG: hypothetical protein ABSH14_01940 [Verrucomicrobiia bacterium]|jgi:hypothetical protein